MVGGCVRGLWLGGMGFIICSSVLLASCRTYYTVYIPYITFDTAKVEK